MEYSDELVGDMQKCWKEEHGIDLSREVANQYLDSLGRLYLVFSEIEQERQRKKDAQY